MLFRSVDGGVGLDCGGDHHVAVPLAVEIGVVDVVVVDHLGSHTILLYVTPIFWHMNREFLP